MSDLRGFETCKQELQRLLDEVASNLQAARAAGPDALHAAVLTEPRKLVDYTNRTEPKDIFDTTEFENIRKLDQLADEARREIFGDSAEAIIGRLHDRASQLNQLAKAVKQQAAENEHNAKKIRLIPVRNAIEAVTDTLDAFKRAKETLSDDDPDEAAVKAKMEGVLRAITALEKAARDF
jgi:primosomal protein N''